MSKTETFSAASLPATAHAITIGPMLQSSSVIEAIRLSKAIALVPPQAEHWTFHRRKTNSPSQAEIARAVRAVKQAGGGFDVEVMSDRIRLAPCHDDGLGVSPKTKKTRDFVL